MRRQRTKMPTMMPSRLMRSMSVILIAFADRTRKITDILGVRERVSLGVIYKIVSNCKPKELLGLIAKATVRSIKASTWFGNISLCGCLPVRPGFA